ncbi:WD repeat-containing protein 5 [Hondaea fermentalgiana]|uniref:WD repeat-containing protein 5 n=1 Tax=Hondaea fermentalgiana TaxID=2315210 RepID=A0A2R5GQD8_9STRA|nr:WD repeat-containing protein 5 [Hondaea fermentalgiana]|eukprot:GBG30843.1 WD repeat-containing protein 5 [Hondaea fermentalgiana]
MGRGGAGAGGEEAAELKRRVDNLEAENRELKRSVFELSTRLGELQWLLKKAHTRPFEVEAPDVGTAADGSQLRPSVLLGGSPSLGPLNSAGMPQAFEQLGESYGASYMSTGVQQPQHHHIAGMRPRNSSLAFPVDMGFSTETHLARSQSTTSFEDVRIAGPGASNLGAVERVMNAFKLPLEAQRTSQAVSYLNPLDKTFELAHHDGAVYCCKWAPNGRWLASGSFDHTIAVCAVNAEALRLTTDTKLRVTALSAETTSNPSPVEMAFRLVGHSQLVSDIKWTCDCSMLVSGSFDQTVRFWDLARAHAAFQTSLQSVGNDNDGTGAATGDGNGQTNSASHGSANSNGQNGSSSNNNKDGASRDDDNESNDGGRRTGSEVRPMQTFKLDGFLHAVETDRTQPMLAYAGTSKGSLVAVDGRSSNAPVVYFRTAREENIGAINMVHIPMNAPNTLFSASAKGVVHAWDLRMQTPLDTFTPLLNDPAGRPVTNLVTGVAADGSHLLAVNSYDNVLRVYDAEGLLSRQRTAPSSGDGSSERNDEEGGNKSGGESVPKLGTPTPAHSLFSLLGHRNKNWPIRASFFSPVGASDISVASANTVSPRGGLGPRVDALGRPLASLLATGSASSSVYVYGLTTEDAQLLHKLKGHSGRVYATDFAPLTDFPLLATCSADATVRLWLPM